MAATFGNLLQTIVSFLVEGGGQAAGRGGGGLLLAGARKIGWAKAEEKKEGRIKGHSLSGHSMGAGFGRRRDLVNYSPKDAHKQILSEQRTRGQRTGSGLLQKSTDKSRPSNLFGRPIFQGASTLSGNRQDRWVKNQPKAARSATPRPRSFIKT